MAKNIIIFLGCLKYCRILVVPRIERIFSFIAIFLIHNISVIEKKFIHILHSNFESFEKVGQTPLDSTIRGETVLILYQYVNDKL